MLTGPIRLDGRLDEAAWQQARAIDNLTMSEPTPGVAPSARTVVRVLADAKTLFVGVRCEDPDPAGIVSFTKARDGSLQNEDHVKLVLDTFRDGRSGYVFAVNPGGARYDALVNPGGESENANWDGLWEAATSRDAGGWSLEVRIPVATLSFKPGLTAWNFNIQRRIQRLQETDRWSGWSRDYEVTQTSRAGELTGLPAFDLGLGLSVRPAVTTGGGIPAQDADVKGSFQPSVDVTQRLGSNLLGSLTVNTDFAETEVDTRRTNLTRFPLFFPEKRTFFLQGADIFAFGLGLGELLLPYYSRRDGLGSDSNAYGATVDYPNDLWDTVAKYSRVGKDFDPSLGFVVRPGVHSYSFRTEYKPRPTFWNIRQMFFEYENSLVTNLESRWESYRVFTAPVNWRFETGDRAEFNWVPTGERLSAPFEVVPDVVIAPGSYHWTRWRLEAGTASKRRFSTQVTWWFGGFYDGTLHQLIWTASWNPAPIVTVELTGEYDEGRLTAGDFRTTVAGTRVRLNISPDVTLSSYLQYDTLSRSFGTNTRLRWTVRSAGDLFVIYNHNVRDLTDRWQLDSNQVLVKFQVPNSGAECFDPRFVVLGHRRTERTATSPSVSGRARTRS